MSGDIKPLFLDGAGDCACKTAYCLNTGYAGCSVLTIIRKMREISPFVLPGGAWPDMDGLEIGHLTPAQERTQMSFWAALKSPLMISTDLSTVSNETLSVLVNKDIIAISQDEKGSAARFIPELSEEKSKQVWAEELSGDRVVVLVLNERNSTQEVDVPLGSISMLENDAKYGVRDVWLRNSTQVVSGNIKVAVQSHDTKVLVFELHN